MDDQIMFDLETILNKTFRNLKDFIKIKSPVLFVLENSDEFNFQFVEYLRTLREFYSGLLDLRPYLIEAKDIMIDPTSKEMINLSLTPLEERVIELYLSNSENYDIIEFLDYFINYGLSFQKQPLSYIFSSLISTRDDDLQGLILLNQQSKTFLLDLLKGYSDQILFYYPINSSKKFSIFLPKSEIERDNFFSWLLVYFNENINFNDLKSNKLKRDLVNLKRFIYGKEKVPFLEPIRPLVSENLKAYKDYDLLSILKFGIELNKKNAENLFDYLIGSDPELEFIEAIPTEKLGVCSSINFALNVIEYLVVDYTNEVEEGLFFKDFSTIYVVPAIKFKKYIENGDLYVLGFFDRGFTVKPFRNPKESVKLKYFTERLDDMIKFNKKNIKRFEKFLEQNLKNSILYLKNTSLSHKVGYILGEQIKPYFGFIKSMDVKMKIYSDKNQFKRLLKMYTWKKSE